MRLACGFGETTALARARRAVSTLVFGLVVAAAFATMFASPAAAQSRLGQPNVWVDVSGGTATFSWHPGTGDYQNSAPSFVVDGTDGANCDAFAAGETHGLTSATSTSCQLPGAGELCVSVQVRASLGSAPSDFSNWLCVTADPFYVSGSYAPDPRRVGWITETVPIPVTAPQTCLADLATTPARYMCVAEADLDSTITDLQATPDIGDRVVWVGGAGERVVSDFDPLLLRADVGIVEATLEPRPVSPGVDIELIYTVGNDSDPASADSATAPTVGFQVDVSSHVTITSMPPNCSLYATFVSCYIGRWRQAHSARFSSERPSMLMRPTTS